MNKNDKLRGLEIRFYLICYDVTRLSSPPALKNVFEFFDFLEKIDFTKTLNYDILKTLAQKIFTEQTNIQPNTTELCNFCLTHKIKLKDIQKYSKIPKPLFDSIIYSIQNELFYQPIHLKNEIYSEIEKFIKLVDKLKSIGVNINEKRIKR